MKNKKGFISITVVYSFFLVFLMMLLSITASYVNNRMLLKTMKDDIKNDLGYHMSTYLKNNYQNLGMDYHNSSLANGANDNSYRFSGANPNNYVCFGPGATPARTACPEENQYRIIGVFGDQVKLIKKTSLGHRQWDNKGQYGDNTWSTSLINAYLNGEYLNNLTTTWSNKIATTTWQVGGMTLANGSRAVPATAYNYELGTNKVNVTFNGKIGLMYVSDYGFAASPNFWTIILSDYDPTNGSDWLNINIHEWTMSRRSDNSSIVFEVMSIDYVDQAYSNYSGGVRAVFYLESSVKLIGGDGTAIDPYRIK